MQKRIASQVIAVHAQLPGPWHHNFASACLRTLRNEGYPNASTSIKIISQGFLQNIVVLEPGLAQLLLGFKARVAKSQTALDTPALLDYQHKIFGDKLRIPGVIGGHLERLHVLNKFFLKRMGGYQGVNEIFNYFLLHRLFPKLVPAMVRCFGLLFVSPDFKISDASMDALVARGKTHSKAAVFYPLEK